MVRQASQGDPGAQAILYESYSRAMFNICLRMTGNRHDAEDLLQEAFIKAFRGMDKLQDHALFGAWLRRIVMNECFLMLRSKKIPWQDIDQVPVLEMADYTEESAADHFTAAELHEGISRLPDGCRQVLVLFLLEDFPHRKIAEELGISESTSKSQYHYAKKLLREDLYKKKEYETGRDYKATAG